METINHTLKDKTKLTLFKGDHITNVIVRSDYYYESAMLLFIRDNIPKGLFIDVGENIGNHTVFFAKYCASSVMSFEPFPDTFKLLAKNIHQNDLENTKIFNVGLSDTNEDISMLAVSGNAVMNKVDKTGTIKAKLIVFDPCFVISDKNPVTLIKIDCEGYEEKAILGMINIINKYHPALFIECQTDKELFEMRKLLKPLGYDDRYKFNATPTYFFSHQNK